MRPVNAANVSAPGSTGDDIAIAGTGGASIATRAMLDGGSTTAFASGVQSVEHFVVFNAQFTVSTLLTHESWVHLSKQTNLSVNDGAQIWRAE